MTQGIERDASASDFLLHFTATAQATTMTPTWRAPNGRLRLGRSQISRTRQLSHLRPVTYASGRTGVSGYR